MNSYSHLVLDLLDCTIKIKIGGEFLMLGSRDINKSLIQRELLSGLDTKNAYFHTQIIIYTRDMISGSHIFLLALSHTKRRSTVMIYPDISFIF
jgi:hypothetical protein